MNLTVKSGSTKNNKTGGWRTFIPKVDYNKCIGCGMCVRVCPENCVLMQKKGNKQQPKIDYDYCKGCGLCASECPVKCIKMELENK